MFVTKMQDVLAMIKMKIFREVVVSPHHLGHVRRTFIMEEDKTGTISEGGMVRYFVLSYSIVKDGNYHAFLL